MGCGASRVSPAHVLRRRRADKAREYRRQVMKTSKHFSLAGLLNDDRFSSIADVLTTVPVPMLAWSEDGEVVHANCKALDVLGHDETTLRVGIHFSKLLELAPEYRDDVTPALYKSINVQVVRRTGQRMDAKLTITVIEVSERVVYLGTITETYAESDTSSNGVPSPSSLKSSPESEACDDAIVFSPRSPRRSPRSPRQVRTSHTQLADDALNLMDALKNPVMLLTSAGQIVHWNKGCERVFGPTAEEAIGHDMNNFVPAPYDQYHKILMKEASKKQGKNKPQLSQSIDVVARTVSSPSQEVLRNDGTREKVESMLIPLQIMVGEIRAGASGEAYWLVVCNRPASLSLKHHNLLAEINPTSARLPDKKPPLQTPSQSPLNKLTVLSIRTPPHEVGHVELPPLW
eukprot:Hpha_TRINITY_DN15780_c1_g5::TRINITY_DN15780_c1_g5_i1::g.41743::m.41743